MELWDAIGMDNAQLSLLCFGHESNSIRAKWGPGRRNHYILHYVLEGKGWFNGVPVEKGAGFLIRPMEQVAYHPDKERPWRYFWISMNGELARQICQNHIHADENGVFPWSDASLIRELLLQLGEKSRELEPMYALSVLYQILACHEAEHCRPGNLYVEQAKQMIRQHLSDRLTVTEVAAACKVDDRYLYNLFIKHTGMSPKQYMNALRLRNAKALLRESDCAVAEVAASLGFEDPLAFSRFFNAHAGLSPSAYRKAHRM